MLDPYSNIPPLTALAILTMSVVRLVRPESQFYLIRDNMKGKGGMDNLRNSEE